MQQMPAYMRILTQALTDAKMPYQWRNRLVSPVVYVWIAWNNVNITHTSAPTPFSWPGQENIA
jgi:hypothetical protein